MDADTLLKRLDDEAPGGPLDALAALSVEQLLALPVGHFVTPELVVRVARQALTGWLDSAEATGALERVVEETANRLSVDHRTLKEAVPREVTEALREVLGRPFSPDKRVVLTVIDRGPTRELVRDILLHAVLDFGKRLSSPVKGMAKGLGSLARMGVESVASRGGKLGGLVGAVSGEVERQLEKRAVEFVDSALSGVFSQIADSVSDPRRAAEAAELRVELLNGALGLKLSQLSRELVNLDVPGGAQVVRTGLAQWLKSDTSDDELRRLAERLLEHDAGHPLHEVLAELGLLTPARSLGQELLRARLKDVVATPAFAQWLAGVMA